MKKNQFNYVSLIVVVFMMLSGCEKQQEEPQPSQTNTNANVQYGTNKEQETNRPFKPELQVSFGREGTPFTMNLYDNETARAIFEYVGTSDWNLPIYHYDDYENYEVMQYYDIPSRYDIPSDPETITSQKAGEVFYSEPNRIVLFYQDANVSGEYTRLGTFDASEEFRSAVENNPVIEGWGNKIVSIRPAD